MGKYLITTHRCELPAIEPSHNADTVWECDCLKKHILVNHWDGTSQTLSWLPLHAARWNEAEQRLNTPYEASLWWQAQGIPTYQPTRWERISNFFRRD